MTGRPADPGLDADLATLRHWANSKNMREAVKRVEAELSRLREERDAALETAEYHQRLHAQASEHARGMRKRAEAAEAECARLQQALATAGTAIERATFDAHDREWARQVMASIRDALAGPDTPADSPEKCPKGGTHARIAHPGGRCIKCGGSPADSQEDKT